jgi:hypothetical protein
MAPTLGFSITDAAPLDLAAAPTVRFGIEVRSDEPVRSLLLDTQVRIAARARGYDDHEVVRLFELFGAKGDWGNTLRSLLWARSTLVAPPFDGSTRLELDIPCTYDLHVTASRYFDALDGGDVPLEFLFSGSVFYMGASGFLQTERLSWEQEAAFRMPVATWKATMERHFADTAWLRLSKPAFDRLAAYKSRHALPTWEAALEALLVEPEEPAWTR